jgi:hypothetical protein
MQDFKLEYTEPDKVYETVDNIKDKEPQYLYYDIEVEHFKEMAEDEATAYDVYDAE